MFWLGKHYKSYGLYSLKITPPPLSMLRVKINSAKPKERGIFAHLII